MVIEHYLLHEVPSKNLSEFNCGHEGVNAYFHTRAKKDVDDGFGVTHVYKCSEEKRIMGMVTLKTSLLLFHETHETSGIPAMEIYMLALDLSYQGKKAIVQSEETRLSDYVLFQVQTICESVAQGQMGAKFLIVNSINEERALSLYRRNGFADLDRFLHYVPSVQDANGVQDCSVLVSKLDV